MPPIQLFQKLITQMSSENICLSSFHVSMLKKEGLFRSAHSVQIFCVYGEVSAWIKQHITTYGYISSPPTPPPSCCWCWQNRPWWPEYRKPWPKKNTLSQFIKKQDRHFSSVSYFLATVLIFRFGSSYLSWQHTCVCHQDCRLLWSSDTSITITIVNVKCL